MPWKRRSRALQRDPRPLIGELSPNASITDLEVNACQSLHQRIAKVLEPRPEVLEAYLFGSHARGTAQAHSDIDIAVYVDESRVEESAFGYRAQLTTLLIAGLHNNDIDLLVLNHAPPVLYYHVLRDGVRILSRDLMETTTREGYAVSRYCDFVPHLAKMDLWLTPPGGEQGAERTTAPP